MITGKRISFFIALLTVVTLAALLLPLTQVGAQSSKADTLSRESILHDPQAPAAGNPKGDITIVEWFDYQCPFCKKMNPDLMKTVHDDGHIRLVFKDWPVFGAVSVYAAKLVLATKYQHKYLEAHDALMAIDGKLSEDKVRAALTKAGINVERAQRDWTTHRQAIDALLARNDQQAVALGFQGTPAFIIGHFRVPGALDPANLKLAIKDARAALRKSK